MTVRSTARGALPHYDDSLAHTGRERVQRL